MSSIEAIILKIQFERGRLRNIIGRDFTDQSHRLTHGFTVNPPVADREDIRVVSTN
jgi:hypothetical protein